MRTISALTVIILLGFIFLFVDMIASKTELFYGNVIDKYYKPEKNSTGVGYLTTGTSTSGIIVTSEYESEQFLLIVKTEKGNIVTARCHPELYYEKQINQKVYCKAFKGGFTGITWSIYGVQ
jgi:hypothetical protein